MRYLVFGIGDFADVVYQKLKYCGISVDAFCIDKEYLADERMKNGVPIIPYEDFIKSSHEYGVFIAVIGKKCMFEQRKKIFNRINADGFKIENLVVPSAKVLTNEIGYGNIIMENVVIEAHCVVGNGNIIWPNVVMPHHNKVGSFNNISPSVSFSGYSEIGSQCFIGNNSCLNNGIRINDKALVGAGVFANENLDSESVLVSERAYVLEGRKSWEFK